MPCEHVANTDVDGDAPDEHPEHALEGIADVEQHDAEAEDDNGHKDTQEEVVSQFFRRR